MALLAVFLVLGATTGAGAQERLAAWTKEFALAGAWSISQNLSGTESGRTGFQILPHLGLVVTDPAGPGWLRGQLEALAEPTLVHVDGRESANLVGASLVGRWVFAAGHGHVRPYVEAGAGVLTGPSGVLQMGCDVSFGLEAGTGLLLFWSETHAVTIGYRLHHLSNGDLCSPNRGLNSSAFVIGVSEFFR